VGIAGIWGLAFGTSAKTIKADLSAIVDRRNIIVHACDNDPSTYGSLYALTDVDALDAVNKIYAIVLGIEHHC
jgi:hypothetical protein